MQIAREPRRKVMIRATMRAGGPRADVCVRDISSRGMMIQASAPPPRGTFVDVDCAGQQIVGLVVWRKAHRFGVQTRDRLDVRALAGRGPQAAVVAPRRTTAGPAARPAARAQAGASRSLGARMEFALVALFAAALIAGLGTAAFETLSRPFGAVSDQLRH